MMAQLININFSKLQKSHFKKLIKPFLILFLLNFIALNSKAQIKYAAKFEFSFQKYGFRTITYDPGPNWRGYNLRDKPDGLCLSVSNGISLANKKLFFGVALAYHNFEGINGVSAAADLEYIPLKTKLSPLVNFKLGYNHVWNQYPDGSGTNYGEYLLGLNYLINSKNSIYLKSGILFTQESLFIPICLGFRI